MGEPEEGLGGVEPRKKPSWLIVGVIAVVVIAATMFFTGGNEDKPANSGTNSSTPVVTIPQLKNSIDSLNVKVDGFSGRLANLESQMAGVVAPTVTKAEFNSLQTQLNTLEATVANFTSTGNGGDSDNTTIEEVTEWDMDVWVYYNNFNDYGKVSFDLPYSHPRDIEEEDAYNIYLTLYNNNIKIAYGEGNKPVNDETNPDVDIGSFWLYNSMMYKCTNTIVSEPPSVTTFVWTEVTVMSEIYNPVLLDSIELCFRPDDKVKVAKDEIYLGNRYGNDWEAEIVERFDGTCRKIETNSGKFTLPIPDNFGDAYPLELEFELYYA